MVSPESRKNIFIIEDDTFLVKAYQIKFTKEGYNVVIAVDGQEAIAMLATLEPCLVMLDLVLPGMSGFKVLTAIRNDPRWKDVPVIVLSNLSQSQDIEKAKALGVTEYVIKANTRINDIVEMVRRLTP